MPAEDIRRVVASIDVLVLDNHALMQIVTIVIAYTDMLRVLLDIPVLMIPRAPSLLGRMNGGARSSLPLPLTSSRS